MVVLRCLILCFKFTKKSFVGQALPGPAGGVYSAPPDLLAGSWGKGVERGWKSASGRQRGGTEGEGMRGDGRGGNPGYGHG